MITILPAQQRGTTQLPWLDSRHTFSFGEYYNPQQMGFRSLRVINEDWVKPSFGFPLHKHHDMEIISCVLAGAMAHKDSLGNGSTIHAGEIQRMSAGTGIQHSEWNESATKPLHFLQIWLLPAHENTSPSYDQRFFELTAMENKLCLIGSRDARENSILIQQDVALYRAKMNAGHIINYTFARDRYGWMQVIQGKICLCGNKLNAGDGAALSHETTITLQAIEDADILLFDLA